MAYALKTIREDGTTRNWFKWPDKGPIEEISNIDPANNGPCPGRLGDGICLGKTFFGMAQGGIPARHILTIRYRQKDVLGEDSEKLRVRSCIVLKRYTIKEYLRNKKDADLQGANLQGADLQGAIR